MSQRSRAITAGVPARRPGDPAVSSFDTPDPISVSVGLGTGDLRIAAGDRHDTVVEVRPSDPARGSDVSAAERTRVEFTGGALVVRAPTRWGEDAPWPMRAASTLLGPRGGGESVDVEIALPAGSHLRVDAGMAAVSCAGRLGECHIKLGAGEIRLDAAGPVDLRTGAGAITVDRVAGLVEVRTGTGEVRIGAIDGYAVVKNSCGDTWIGEVTGGLQVNASFGRISVDRADAEVAARTAYGDVRLGDVARGAIVAQTGFGKVDVGVRDGVAAWLDLETRHGAVVNELKEAGAPGQGEDSVEVRARTAFGDITLHRS
jgi:hypothetical protein